MAVVVKLMPKKKVPVVQVNSRVVVGLDVSTKTGLVVIGAASVVLSKEVDVSAMGSGTPMERIKRAMHLGQEVFSTVGMFKPVVAVIEGYSYGNPFQREYLAELGAAVRMACVQAGCPFVEVAPVSLKKFISGDTKVKKNEIMMLVLKRWGFVSATDNIADAYGLGQIGLRYSGMVPMSNGYERELVGTLKR